MTTTQRYARALAETAWAVGGEFPDCPAPPRRPRGVVWLLVRPPLGTSEDIGAATERRAGGSGPWDPEAAPARCR